LETTKTIQISNLSGCTHGFSADERGFFMVIADEEGSYISCVEELGILINAGEYKLNNILREMIYAGGCPKSKER